ncbi:MAG: IS66 family transposase [Acidobacteria bacterium]|nr:IS66 family transposase [Acidobacteriota bacterium]
MERQLANRNHALFGDKSERRERPGEGDSADITGGRDVKPRRGHGPRAQQTELPVVEVVHELDKLPEEERVCELCGGVVEEWPGQFEESDEVDVVERHFVLKHHKRKKGKCECGCTIRTAPPPAKAVAGGRYSLDFAVDVAVQKYLDHLPLERQVRIMTREGLVVDSQTLWDQLWGLAVLLKDVPERLRQHLLSDGMVLVDETPWRLIPGRGQKGAGTKRCWVWSIATPAGVFYRIQEHRSAEAAATLLGDYAGVVMCDAMSAYLSLAKQRPSLTIANCWAHARRRVWEVRESFPIETKQALDLIGELYAVERLCPAGRAGDALRLQLRQERSRPIVEKLRTSAMTTPALPESGLGKAISYMTGIWSGLTRFLDDPRIPLDNNRVESALRDPVMGRHNFHGSRSKRGLEVAGLFYTLLHSAKVVGLEPREYLRRAAQAAAADQPVPLPHELLAT